MIKSRFVAILCAIAVASLSVAITGCVPRAPLAVPSLSVSVSPTLAAPERVDPVSAFDIACSDLASDDEIATVVGEPGAQISPPSASAAYHGALIAAVLADGGMSCEWPTGDTSLSFSRLSVVALPDAAGLYERAKSKLMERPFPWFPSFTSFDYFDGALVECSDYNGWGTSYVCRWHVLVDDVWLAIELGGVPETDYHVPVPRENPDTSRKPIEAVVDGSASLGLITTIVDSISSAPRIVVEHVAAVLPNCSALIDVASLQPLAVSPIEVVRDDEPPELDPAPASESLQLFSMERLGFRHCVVATTSEWTVISRVLSDVDWLIEPPFAAPQGTLREVEGLGSVYEFCSGDESGEFCAVTVVGDRAIIAMQLDNSKDSAIPIAVARSILAALGE